jgi:hypothetical protein
MECGDLSPLSIALTCQRRSTWDKVATDRGGRRRQVAAFQSADKSAHSKAVSRCACHRTPNSCRLAGWARNGETINILD